MDENVNPTDALLKQGFLSEKFFPDILSIKTEPLTDSYTIEPRPFARGKFATVRRCRHKTSGQDFAAKCIRKRRRAVDVRHEILHEVCVLKLTNNTNKRIVRLHEVFETPTEVILVLEMLSGGELQRLIDDEETICEADVSRLMRQILEGLDFLHERKIAHLDIKPQNILLTSSFPQCDVKLCDFGISRMITKGVEIREIVGTPDYVAPEVLHYEPIGLATDMWSVGILAYVLLSGHTPFGGDTKQETFCNITNGSLDFPKYLFGQASNSAKDFITRLLVREPSGRMTVKECLNHVWLNGHQNLDNAINQQESSPSSVPLILSLSEENLAILDPPTPSPSSTTVHHQHTSQHTNTAIADKTPFHPCSTNHQSLSDCSSIKDDALSPSTNEESSLCSRKNSLNKRTLEVDLEAAEDTTTYNKSEKPTDRLSDESATVVESRLQPTVEESSQEVAIVPLEAVLEEIAHQDTVQSKLDEHPSPGGVGSQEEPASDATTSHIQSISEVGGHCNGKESLKVLKEQHQNTTVFNHHVHVACCTTTTSSTTLSERQSMKTKSEMVEFEGLALSKRLIFSDEIMVDERMGMVY